MLTSSKRFNPWPNSFSCWAITPNFVELTVENKQERMKLLCTCFNKCHAHILCYNGFSIIKISVDVPLVSKPLPVSLCRCMLRNLAAFDIWTWYWAVEWRAFFLFYWKIKQNFIPLAVFNESEYMSEVIRHVFPFIQCYIHQMFEIQLKVFLKTPEYMQLIRWNPQVRSCVRCRRHSNASTEKWMNINVWICGSCSSQQLVDLFAHLPPPQRTWCCYVIAVLHIPSLSFILIEQSTATHTSVHAVLSSIDMKTQHNTAHIIIFMDLSTGRLLLTTMLCPH